MISRWAIGGNRGPSRANPTLRNRRKASSNQSCPLELFLSALLIILFILMATSYYVMFGSYDPNAPKEKNPAYLKENAAPSLFDTPLDSKSSKEDAANLQKQIQSLEKANNPPSPQTHGQPHLYPPLPPLPIFENTPQAWEATALLRDTLQDRKPTILGIATHLQKFLALFHEQNMILSKEKADYSKVINTYFTLAEQHLLPFDQLYRGKPIFPIRDDDSIYLSLASFREHLLTETLIQAFTHAKNPSKLYIGAIVQNCFGRVDEYGEIHTSDNPCKTGAQVVGKNKKGRDMTKVSDVPPDVNGIEVFCTDPEYKKFCDAGQVRVLYVHETESLGPAIARYYASKLWGGESYFVQTDSHLQFARHWDEKYISDIRATKNYPKSVLSSYPPGWNGDSGGEVHETPGARLCSCEFSTSDVEKQIIRINVGGSNKGGEGRPTQIPFIAAGFFFVRAEFLVDVPFDPFLPWCFMGEEIALSVRAWTSGWDIYAPRKNLISHQYRPGRMGLPKFWGSVNRLYGRPGMNNNLQGRVIKRVKNLVGYPETTRELVEEDGDGVVLTELEHYGVGNVRSLEDYMEWTGIDVVNKRCPPIKWCAKGELD